MPTTQQFFVKLRTLMTSKLLQRQFTEICKWLDLNGLVLNAEKTKTMLFGGKKE